MVCDPGVHCPGDLPAPGAGHGVTGGQHQVTQGDGGQVAAAGGGRDTCHVILAPHGLRGLEVRDQGPGGHVCPRVCHNSRGAGASLDHRDHLNLLQLLLLLHHLVCVMILLEVGLEIVLAAAGVAAELALEGLVVRVSVHVVPQPLLVRVLVAADVALVGLGVAVGPLVPGHGGGGVGAEPTRVAHEGPLVSVLEPHVLVQSRLLHCGVVTVTASEPRKVNSIVTGS